MQVFSHIMIGTNDLVKAKAFYDALLGTIGVPPAQVDRHRIFYRTPTGVFSVSKPINGKPATAANGGTVGFACSSTQQADAWQAAGIANGGTSLRRAMRASPHDPLTWLCTFWIGIFQYFSGEYAATPDTMREVIDIVPGFANRYLAAALGQLGRTAEAKVALEKSIAVSPEVFKRLVRQRPPWMRPEDYVHVREGLRKAGWEG